MPPGEWIVDAYRDGKRFVVRADEKLTALFETKITGSRRHRRQSPKVRLQRSNYAIVDHLGESEVFAEFGVNLATKILRTGLHKIALNFCGGASSGVVAL
jgi:hypothetical protein